VTVLLDTHVWVWWLLGSNRIANKERQELDRLASQGELERVIKLGEFPQIPLRKEHAGACVRVVWGQISPLLR